MQKEEGERKERIELGLFKFKKPRLSTMSPIPAIYALRSTVREMKNFSENVPKRVTRSQELFLLEIAGILRKKVQNIAPDVKIAGKERDYAKQLRIGVLEGTDDENAVAIYFDGANAKIGPEDMENTVLFFRLTSVSPEWVPVLVRWGPWPAGMLPLVVNPGYAKIITRHVSPKEMAVISKRLYARRGEIEKDFKDAGVENPQIRATEYALGVDVVEDVGYNVLRKEFGFDGEFKPHWRPALRSLKDDYKLVMKKMVKYLLEGRESIFDIPDDVGTISTVAVRQGEYFQKTIAPFVPKGS